MKRRQFSAALTASAAVALPAMSLSIGVFAPSAVRAQGATPQEGQDYLKLGRQLPVSPGKIEVIEFFWYGCPHCNAFEPTLEPWVSTLPSDVAFKRVPVAFREEPFVPHQKIYYALEALGQVSRMHERVFAAIHVEHKRMDTPEEIAAFMDKNGIEPKKFLESYNSFGVAAKAKQATQISEDFQVNDVPSLGVQGRYLTSGPISGTVHPSLPVVNYLIAKVRQGA
jgi:thiol:disulfide interchange protein DsbA